RRQPLRPVEGRELLPGEAVVLPGMDLTQLAALLDRQPADGRGDDLGRLDGPGQDVGQHRRCSGELVCSSELVAEGFGLPDTPVGEAGASLVAADDPVDGKTAL